MSVKQPYSSDWKEKVRARIKRTHGVIALISNNSIYSSGQKWEIECAKQENKRVLGIWAYSNDRTLIWGIRTIEWNWTDISAFLYSV